MCGSECVSERQVLVLFSALVSLAHHIVEVSFLSWQVLGSTYISVSQRQKRITDVAAQNIILQFHSRQEHDTSVCDSHVTCPKTSFLDPAKSLPGLSTGRSENLFPAVEAGFLWSRCGNKFHLEQVGQCKQLLVQLEPEGEAASGGAGCRT